MSNGRLRTRMKNHPRLTILVGALIVLWLAAWTVGHWNVGSGLRGTLEVNNKSNSKTLVVLVHGVGGDGDKMNAVRARVRQNDQYKDANIYQPEYNAHPLSNTDPSGIAALLEQKISQFHSHHDYSNIVLIGHSMGDLL